MISPVPNTFGSGGAMFSGAGGGGFCCNGGGAIGGAGISGLGGTMMISLKLLPVERPPACRSIFKIASDRGSVKGLAASVRI